MGKRRDKCKCGKFLSWDPHDDNEVICRHCKTKYGIESDSILVYWLKERISYLNCYETDAR